MMWFGKWRSTRPRRWAWSIASIRSRSGRFGGTSITSQAWPQEKIASELPANPHLLLGDGSRRGYVAFDLRPGQLQADLRVFENVRDRNARGSSLAKFAVNDGKPGPLRS